MSTFEDITQEELAVFLQEADEQIQLLDEDLLRLEKEGSNMDLLQEIFRAAHTLKGSSGMMGLEDMQRVAHAAETVLDKLRNQTLAINTGVIDALLHSLDVLKALQQNLLSGEDEDVDIETVLGELVRAGEGGGAAVEEHKTQVKKLDRTKIAEARLAVEPDRSLYVLRVEVSPESPFPAVRAFQVLDELSRHGDIPFSEPSREDIEAGAEDRLIQLCLATTGTRDDLIKALDDIPELANVAVLTENELDAAEAAADTGTSRDTADTRQPKKQTQKNTRAAQTVRVDVALLDDLMNMVGEMVIERNKIRQTVKTLEAKYEGDETVGSLQETATRIIKLVSELQENILQARMLPIGTVFNGFPRLIRDLAQNMTKKIELITDGQETELDRTILEQIRDPLVHLLRNSVDHGIEAPEDRVAAGKAEKGVILLSAYQEQNHIIIVVEDDGKGIDVTKVKQASVKKGFITQEEADRLSDEEAIDLIFSSGLSTAGKVTEVSGRGVGMDVVRTNIESVGGQIAIESKIQEGTRFTIRLPLTLATINGLLVASSDTVYVIPMASLVEVLKIKTGEIEHVSGKEIIRVRDQLLPLYKLDAEFGHVAAASPTDDLLVVIIRSGSRAAGLVVDSVMETQETVVKSLGKYIGTVKGIAGSTILGDGQVALILDTATLVTGMAVN